MNKIETITEIDDAICNLTDAVYHLNRTLKSDHVYQARIEQFTHSIGTIIDELEDTCNEIDEEVCTEVRKAIIDDRQYAFEMVDEFLDRGNCAHLPKHLSVGKPIVT